jgi:pimeloyl-ACP methyl ester carboxylesterase
MKPNLILLHGALGSKRYLQTLKAELIADYNVFDLDFSGHGDDQDQRPFSIELFAQNVLDFIQEKGITQTHVFGYSMGGYVAITAALKSPKLFQDIVTYGTKFNWSPEIAAQEVQLLNPEKVEEKVPAFAASLRTLHTPNDWKMVMTKTAQLMLGLGDGKGLKSADFERVSNKVTIGWGSADKMVSESESINVVNLLQNGNFASLKDQPHPIEKVVLDFLLAYILENLK